MAAFPLYSPLICPPGWEPDFVAGATQCTLQTGNVKRSRLEIGGSFFRSVETAASFPVNEIELTCIVILTGNEGVDTDVYSVDFSITDPINGTITIPTFTQKYNNDTGSCVAGFDGPGQLRTKISAGSPPYVISMPEIDNPALWDSSTDDACLLTSFGGSPIVLLDGGVGLPIYSSGIRTGPTYALFHIDNADTAENGDNVTVNEISEWDGINNQWISHPSTSYEIDSAGNITPTPPCP